MARIKIPHIITAVDGVTGDLQPIQAALISIIDRLSAATHPVYPTESSNVASVQPLSTDAEGRVPGYVDRGAVTLTITLPGRSPYTLDWDATSGADGVITTACLADGSVSTVKIADSTITNAKLGNSAVGTTKIADSAITTAKLADSAVDSTKLANLSVSTAKLADSAVTEPKISPGAVSVTKLATSFLAQVGVSDSVTNRRGHFERAAADTLTTSANPIDFRWITDPAGGVPTSNDDAIDPLYFPAAGLAMIIYRATIRSTVANKAITAAFFFQDATSTNPSKNIFGDTSVSATATPTHTGYMELYTTGTNLGSNGLDIIDNGSGLAPTNAVDGAQMYAVPLFFYVPIAGPYTFGMKYAHAPSGGVQIKSRRLDVVTFATS